MASEHSVSEAMTRAAELRTNGTPLYELSSQESEAIISSLLGPLAEDWFAELHSGDSTWSR
ncbi:MAG TPA: hypothetical protein EYO33_00745 [Phycisphaerales bacterium]|nr:hypothetical protein [Phycisphaerales bacterium]